MIELVIEVLLVLSLIVGPAGPAPRACPPGEEYWQMHYFPDDGYIILANNAFPRLDDPEMQPSVVLRTCHDESIIEVAEEAARERYLVLLVALGEHVYQRVP